MNYFAKSAFETIQEQVTRHRERNLQQRRLIVTTSAFPADVTRDFFNLLDQLAIDDGGIEPTLKVAKILADKWQTEAPLVHDELQRKGWLDTTGNLTGYRNDQVLADIGKLRLVVLVGADRVTDSSSLADFYRCDMTSVWHEQMQGQFDSWIRDRLTRAHVGYDAITIRSFDTVLAALDEYGVADLFHIARLLDSLPLESQDAQDGGDATRVLLSELRRFGLPSFVGFRFSGRKKLGPYIQAARRFFSYDMFLEERAHTKALKTINSLLADQSEQLDASSLFSQELRGPSFDNDRAFVQAVRDYVETEDDDARQSLLHSDFVTVHDQILKFKIGKTSKNDKERVRALVGGPVEAVLTAIWHTLRDYCAEWTTGSRPSLTGIRIEGTHFRYDSEALADGAALPPAEAQEQAREYLLRVVGGVDRFVSEHLELPFSGDDNVIIRSVLCGETLTCAHARTAEPSLEFRVELDTHESKTFGRPFKWRLPDTQSYRIAGELIEWASQRLSDDHVSTAVLPVFHVAYHEELIRAKDDDEIRRVLLHAIREDTPKSTNLLSSDWKTDQLWQHMHDLALAYRKWLEDARANGLHATFHSQTDSFPSTWDELFKAFEAAMRAHVGHEASCQGSGMASMLMSAFLLGPGHPASSSTTATPSFERSAVITVLHPSLVEMLRAHVTYLFSCFNYVAPREWRSDKKLKPFHPNRWQDYLDLAAIRMPLQGLIVDENNTIDARVQGQELIHRVGLPADNDAPLSTRLLLRYEGFDEDEISDAEMFAPTRESRLLGLMLRDYLEIHPHARDGISLAMYRNSDIQPLISAIHGFLESLMKGPDPIIGNHRTRLYYMAITVFTETGSDAGVGRWIEEWRERWEEAEAEDKYSVYRFCRLSVAHRVVPPNDPQRNNFIRMIRDDLDVDIAVLHDFIDSRDSGAKPIPRDSYDVTKRTLKFPILEKPFCTVDNPESRLKRARVISNPQFRLASLHSEIMARMRYASVAPGQEHVLLGQGDFQPWQGVVDELHKRAEWVVCIDPSIDDTLVRPHRAPTEREREIIGFGSGVGIHGELNYVVSTEHFGLSDITYRLTRAIQELFPAWDDGQLRNVAESVVREARTLSGLSLIRATGTSIHEAGKDNYLHDFMGFALASKLLKANTEVLCSHLVTLDAYRHWFSNNDEDGTRPDLLWLVARLDSDSRVHLDMHLVECKLGAMNIAHVDKATRQVRNGLRTLVPVFRPRIGEGDDNRPDQRYWWLQLHRLIASKTSIDKPSQSKVLAAMERLADGEYSISWHGAVLSVWTNSEQSELLRTSTEHYDDGLGNDFVFGIHSTGATGVLRLCAYERIGDIDWLGPPMKFESVSPEDKTSKSATPIAKVEPPVDEVEDEQEDTFEVDSEKEEESEDMEEPEVTLLPKVPARISLGKTVDGERDVYWEFGHEELANRHLLVFGTSGMGKTYAIQCILCELGLEGQNSLVMDYTNGFLPNQLEPATKRIVAPLQHIIRQAPLPVRLFKTQVQEIGDGLVIDENTITAAKRIAGTFCQVYDTLGDQQYSVLLDAVIKTMDTFNENASLELLLQVLESFVDDSQHDKQKVNTTISKLKPFVLEKPFAAGGKGLDWSGIFSDAVNRCHVFQFAGIDPTSARLVIEFTLWDLNAYVRGTGNKSLPKVVVLDEAQNLDLGENAPVAKYMTEGRKFGLSLVLATQTMKNLQGEKLSRLFQAGHKLFFRPADTELQQHAKLMVDAVEGSQQEWVKHLAGLTKGECYSVGPSLNSRTGKLETKAFKIRITALDERFGRG